MISVEQALERVLEAVVPAVSERVDLEQARGRVLAVDVVAGLNLPPWDNSAMDGYAVVASDTSAVPVRLAVAQVLMAGDSPKERVQPGCCVRIMTGAPMPQGADAVVMFENTDGGHEEVVVHKSVEPGRNVRVQGNDVSQGTVVLNRGRTLGASELGLLAALGIPNVEVARRPRIAVLSTGDEVVPVGTPLGPGQIHSSNTHALMALIQEAGAVAVDCGNVPDEPGVLREALARCVQEDMVVTTGGVSAGDHDFVKDAFDSHDAALSFWKVRVKPGKPLAFGHIGGKPAFGLPGNPVSCMVGFLQFVRPVIRSILGDSAPYLPVIQARLSVPLSKKPGRALFARVALGLEAGEVRAVPVSNDSSGALTSMVGADGFALLGEDSSGVAGGSLVDVQVFRCGWQNRATGDYPWS
ncbi:MAG: gephyrin-like molybdotransferase Glp [Myxococcota bacterium]|nr:gephyrin-like molybdotransferase Glp [Myxococcota bacterium]